VLAHGFARLRCAACGFERFVPFSCKGRGFCPSCGGRRMAERAAHLVDRVLPPVPLRQWVLTVPHRLRYLMAWDHRLCRAVLAVYVRVLCGWYRRRGWRHGWTDPRTGTVTAIQRFGGGLNLHVHYHTLVLDGVFVREEAGEAVFHPLPPPTDADVARSLGTIARRVRRLLARRGLLPSGADDTAHDTAADLSPSLALMTAGAVQGREALGEAAGRRIAQVGRDPTRPWQPASGPRQAHQDGFDLHANVGVGPLDRRGREHLVQYVLRPPLAQHRLQRRLRRAGPAAPVAGRHPGPRLLATGGPRAPGGADAAPADQSTTLPWRPGTQRGLARGRGAGGGRGRRARGGGSRGR
jgi:hypothetical protein